MVVDRQKHRPKGTKVDSTPASPIQQAQFLKQIRRAIFVASAREFASDLLANPSMRFEEVARRVRELNSCLTVDAEGKKLPFPTAADTSTTVHLGAERKPLGRRPDTKNAKAYEILDDGGSWKDVWKQLPGKFPTTESRTKVREAYKSRKRRKKGTKSTSSR